MNKEIKEILNKLKDKNNYISHSMILLSIKETTAILDYITNLQKRINKAINIIDIYGTYRYETADLLYNALRGEDNE